MLNNDEVTIQTVKNGWMVFVGGRHVAVDNPPYVFHKWGDMLEFLNNLEELDQLDSR